MASAQISPTDPAGDPPRGEPAGERAADTPASAAATVIRLSRLGHLAAFVLLLCALIPFFGAPAVLWVLLLIPVCISVWLERSRTTVSANGLQLRTLLGTRQVNWPQVKGLRIPERGAVRLHLSDDTEVPLPAVGFDRLPDLVAAAHGHIPDPFPHEHPASHEDPSSPEDPAPHEDPAP